MKRILSVVAYAICLAGCGGSGHDTATAARDRGEFFGCADLCVDPVPPVEPIDSPSGPFTLMGMVQDLKGTGLTLSNGATSVVLEAAAKAFTFADKVAMNVGYDVKVTNQPIDPTQTCTVSNGAGVATATVKDMDVSCVPMAKYVVVAEKGNTAHRIVSYAYDSVTGEIGTDEISSHWQAGLILTDAKTSLIRQLERRLMC